MGFPFMWASKSSLAGTLSGAGGLDMNDFVGRRGPIAGLTQGLQVVSISHTLRCPVVGEIPTSDLELQGKCPKPLSWFSSHAWNCCNKLQRRPWWWLWCQWWQGRCHHWHTYKLFLNAYIKFYISHWANNPKKRRWNSSIPEWICTHSIKLIQLYYTEQDCLAERKWDGKLSETHELNCKMR
jgi:hypothetical protein